MATGQVTDMRIEESDGRSYLCMTVLFGRTTTETRMPLDVPDSLHRVVTRGAAEKMVADWKAKQGSAT